MPDPQSLIPHLSSALNFLFPPQCLQCGEPIALNGGMCVDCWNGVTFITEPFCAACGLPFEHVLEGDNGGPPLCEFCIRAMPPFAKARAVFRYDAASRRLIMRFKYHDQTALAAQLGPWLAKAGRDLLFESDLVVPVPLHYRRYLKRRYNQAALLASLIAKAGAKRCLPDALKRVRPTPQQTGLTRKEREANMSGAFSVNPAYAQKLRGARILLVDDVYTTGATLNACTGTLLKAGAGAVYALTLARRV